VGRGGRVGSRRARDHRSRDALRGALGGGAGAADLRRVPEDPADKFAGLDRDISLREISALDQTIASELAGRVELAAWEECLREASARARERVLTLENLARHSEQVAGMDFTFLFDQSRDLFSIGFNVTEGRRDTSFYDLLASEARLCSYVAIAQGQVPQDHWFALGRLLVAPRVLGDHQACDLDAGRQRSRIHHGLAVVRVAQRTTQLHGAGLGDRELDRAVE
jgi:hypothetical protein